MEDLQFGSCLRKVRMAKGLSQSELASLSGLAYPTISKYECGYMTPNLGNALAIADALGVTLQQLVGREPVVIELNKEVRA